MVVSKVSLSTAAAVYDWTFVRSLAYAALTTYATRGVMHHAQVASEARRGLQHLHAQLKAMPVPARVPIALRPWPVVPEQAPAAAAAASPRHAKGASSPSSARKERKPSDVATMSVLQLRRVLST